ncbi:hypothetical protein Dsin_031173 [Dipteronia sinensis]|uniref:AAA+ ATPase domain-containing protein n=1 Tax=Dipteronia sinensis TaxID=43782 RepID=A0AAE0DS38_9ROSI|nr:hypothetical protein Dsin_031173 [Dipteronia sinensis]
MKFRIAAIKIFRDFENNKHIIGQSEAIGAVSRVIRRAGIGLEDTNGPIGSFLFAGPLGVGKNLLAKSLAREYFGSKESIIKLNMNQYTEKDSVLVLTETVQNRPHSVILLQDIHKAHHNVLIEMIQVLRDGRITDNKGVTLSTSELKEIVETMVKDVCEKLIKTKNIKVTVTDKFKEKLGSKKQLEQSDVSFEELKVGIRDPNRPIGSFLFTGPSGVGKTGPANSLAVEYFGSIKDMIRFDMSEYMEYHMVSKLIGSPPGYYDHEDGGQLTNAIRKKPRSVILLDEIEKAHPDVLNIMLQVLDDDRLTDNNGKAADFKNTIIIMTSNTGSQVVAQEEGEAF